MKKHIWLAIVASALGFFVDLYDIIILSIVRKPSLAAVGILGDEQTTKGVWLINTQMTGMLLGGFIWGIIGDKFGRKSVLFGSIFLYSIATFANAYVTTFDAYLWLRFIAGIGLAGELGAAITLVSEQMPQKYRGLGPAIIASSGMLGAIAGAYIGARYSWQFTYQLGGALGFFLVLLRIGVVESNLFAELKEKTSTRGDLSLIFKNKSNRIKYLSICLMGFPGWFVNGVIMTFTPEIAKSMGMVEIPTVSNVFTAFFIGFTFGDFSCGLFSQWLKSRKKAIFIYLTMFALGMIFFFAFAKYSVWLYYGIFVWLGISAGYTIVLLTLAAEQFGTNIRATVTTSALNLIRATVIPQAFLFNFLRGSYGEATSAMLVGILSIGIAFWSIRNLEETFDKDLNFVTFP